MSVDQIKTRLHQNVAGVRAAIAAACARTNRSPTDVQLVAVTKTVDIATIRLLLDCGVCDFGENRVQQLRQRAVEMGSTLSPLDNRTIHPTPRWHMIGHLQRNKVKPLLDCTRIIHSVDSARLGLEISRHAAAIESEVDVLVEVNISGETSKEGISGQETPALIRELTQMPRLHVRGLMTMAPISENSELARPVFSGLRQLFEQIKVEQMAGPDFCHLSMGMSHDFEVAIEEGATIVRIGSRLFEGLVEAGSQQ